MKERKRAVSQTLDTTLPETEGKTANNGHVSRTSGRKSVH